MTRIKINDSQQLKEIKDAFSAKFPHLKIEFFSEAHKAGEASTQKAMFDDSLYLKDIRTKHVSGELNIDGHQKTRTFETKFYEHFGVPVQVFRKTGNVWLQTTATDDWTLSHQEEEGIKLAYE